MQPTEGKSKGSQEPWPDDFRASLKMAQPHLSYPKRSKVHRLSHSTRDIVQGYTML